MILVNLAIGLLTMMGCLIVQVGFTFWSVRYAVRHAGEPGSGNELFAGSCTLLMVMVIMMLGNFLQIVLWGTLFLCLGEFSEFYEAVYHSGVNFTSLGYGDVVMSADRKLLGPLEALNGILMLGLTGAALVAILQSLTRGAQRLRDHRV
ncbi:MAG: two pore domain potassium channel family protein [Candidatus Accumulibacter sp.]|nr:two pore domain potassium channel family protein [Accumulibacter sp.]